MNIVGLVKTSFVDYPGKIAAVVFTQGCNLRCTYCHNFDLLDIKDTPTCLSPKEIFGFLAQRKGMIDAVVVSGGEPTLQKDLPDFIEEIKALGLLVKLDTNGTKPDLIKALIDAKLLDYIAMDLKAPLHKYVQVTGTSCSKLASVFQSAAIIKSSGLAHEFRTTLCPELEAEDILRIIGDFEIDANYVVQCCRDKDLKKVPKSKQDLQRLKQWSNMNLSLSFRGFEVG